MDENQGLNFDKFMDDIVADELLAKKQTVKQDELTPSREYIRRYREYPANRTRWTR